MTLERHKSFLIPEVEFLPDGTIRQGPGSSTPQARGDGTFPLSHGKRTHGRVPDFGKDANDNVQGNGDIPAYRSYDPKRAARTGQFRRKSSQYEKEMRNISGTFTSSALSSLQRKVTRHLRRGSETDAIPEFGTLRLTATMSDRVRGRRHPPSGGGGSLKSYPGSLDRQKLKRRFSFGLKRKKSDMPADAHVYINGEMPQIMETVEVRMKKISDEQLPSVLFLCGGILMLILGIVKLVLCWWHEAYCPIWTSVMLFVLGVLGRIHNGDYLTHSINVSYITFGGLSTAALLTSCGLLLKVAAPMVVELASGIPGEAVAQRILFTNMGKGLSPLDTNTMAVLNVSLDFVLLVLCLVNFYALTATMVALSNYWDASFTVTGDCDHRGSPRLFNPLEQSMLGIASTFVGLMAVSFTESGTNTYYTPAIAGLIIIFAGISSFCYGKRPDITWLGVFAMVVEFFALVACGVATVFITLALVSEIDNVNVSTVPDSAGMTLMNTDAALKAFRGKAGATIGFSALFYIAMIVNVIFASGILFRVFRKACCSCGYDENLIHSTRF